ncbi:3-deoxy-manno-octulosonate cytidylyltransferase [Striga asiatica]|uniref:3-deoxy-manno-octulosonate cytidylyltransferase n=1 Tax=Striga asiatica TaxID=4170 RepID=A0A5A7RG22_STRAF|nr:3-deoxy-manno-octulosonate cytidylyltransferase [Striga asiatica]
MLPKRCRKCYHALRTELEVAAADPKEVRVMAIFPFGLYLNNAVGLKDVENAANIYDLIFPQLHGFFTANLELPFLTLSSFSLGISVSDSTNLEVLSVSLWTCRTNGPRGSGDMIHHIQISSYSHSTNGFSLVQFLELYNSASFVAHEIES